MQAGGGMSRILENVEKSLERLNDFDLKFKLLPCPFCGGENTLVQVGSHYWSGMRDIVLNYEVRHWCEKGENKFSSRPMTFVAETEEGAIALWNHRV